MKKMYLVLPWVCLALAASAGFASDNNTCPLDDGEDCTVNDNNDDFVDCDSFNYEFSSWRSVVERDCDFWEVKSGDALKCEVDPRTGGGCCPSLSSPTGQKPYCFYPVKRSSSSER